MTHKLLVTGGAGFIGCNFVHYWQAQHPGDTIVVVDALTYAGNRASLAAAETRPNFHFVHGDICDTALIETLLQQYDLDTIVHFAAESHVDRSISGPDIFLNTNINGTHSLLKAARKAWLSGDGREHRFHHISTDEVYGSLNSQDPAFAEDHPYQPNSPYSASKAASDHLVRAYHHTYGLQVTTSNCSNNYGPYHYPEKLIPLAITNLLGGKPVPVYGNGGNIRDWLFVDDHARGIDAILDRGQVGETYNIGGNSEWTNIDLLKLLCENVDKLFAAQPAWHTQYPDAPPARGRRSVEQLTFVDDRPGHDLRYAIDARKIERDLGFKPTTTFTSGLRQVIDWYLRNPQWWRALVKR